MTKQSEVEQVVGVVILEECAKALLDSIKEGDLLEDLVGNLVMSRGYNLDGEWDAETLAARNAAAYDIVEVALERLRSRVAK